MIIQSTGNISCEKYDLAWESYKILDVYGCAGNGEELELLYNSTRSDGSGSGGSSGGGSGGGGIGKKGLLAIKVAVPIVGALVRNNWRVNWWRNLTCVFEIFY